MAEKIWQLYSIVYFDSLMLGIGLMLRSKLRLQSISSKSIQYQALQIYNFI